MGAKVEFHNVLAGAEIEPPPPKPKGFVVRVQRDAGGLYHASWGSSCAALPALSMATALRWLANELEAQGLHGTGEERLAGYVLDPHTLCKYCYAPIFFAHLPKPSEKWLPFDVEPIDGAEVKGERVATFSHNVDARGNLTATWTLRGAGPVWIPHPQTCGLQSEPPENEVFLARWAKRREVSAEKKDRAIARLKDLISNVGDLGDDRQHEPDLSRLRNDGAD